MIFSLYFMPECAGRFLRGCRRRDASHNPREMDFTAPGVVLLDISPASYYPKNRERKPLSHSGHSAGLRRGMTPMTKNRMPLCIERGETPITKNVTVTDETGKIIGATYPRRARGLVKNGRALYVDDCTIRLSARAKPSDDKSEVDQMNYIFFNPREWFFGDATQQNFTSKVQKSAGRSFISDFNGDLVESIMLGGWNVSYAEVVSRVYPLTPDTEYSFVFWLNGGENDKSSETCQLEITFLGNNCYSNIYKLNRNFIKPILHCQGWELYAIQFRTPEAKAESSSAGEFAPVSDTRFSFIAGEAPMAVKPAREPDFYKDWKDEPDEFADKRPQRHNIVFGDGWPSIHMYGGNRYSTEILRRLMMGEQKEAQGHSVPPIPPDNRYAKRRLVMDVRDDLGGSYADLKQRLQELEDRFREHRNRIQLDEETEEGMEEMFDNVEGILSECQDNLDEALSNLDEVQDKLDDAEDQYADAKSVLDEIAASLEKMA